MLRDPNTPDVRRMIDLGGMRPVDVARSYGFQRITALVDPSRPVELLAYITSGALPAPSASLCPPPPLPLPSPLRRQTRSAPSLIGEGLQLPG